MTSAPNKSKCTDRIKGAGGFFNTPPPHDPHHTLNWNPSLAWEECAVCSCHSAKPSYRPRVQLSLTRVFVRVASPLRAVRDRGSLWGSHRRRPCPTDPVAADTHDSSHVHLRYDEQWVLPNPIITSLVSPDTFGHVAQHTFRGFVLPKTITIRGLSLTALLRSSTWVDRLSSTCTGTCCRADATRSCNNTADSSSSFSFS